MFGGGKSAIQTVNFSSAADLVTFDGTFGKGSILGGSGNDTLVFRTGAGFLNDGGVVKTEAGADSLHFSNNTVSGHFGLGAGHDNLSGNISVGVGDVSFWGGSGNDTFNFSSITGPGTGGTAYFWNHTAEADSIVFGSQISIAGLSGRAGVFFGLTSGASLNISFITAQTTQVFGKQVGAAAGTSSVGFGQAFRIANSNKVTYGIDSNNYVTLAFAGGGSLSIQGLSSAEAKAITNTFGLAKGNGNPAGTTGTFGTAGTFPTFS